MPIIPITDGKVYDSRSASLQLDTQAGCSRQCRNEHVLLLVEEAAQSRGKPGLSLGQKLQSLPVLGPKLSRNFFQPLVCHHMPPQHSQISSKQCPCVGTTEALCHKGIPALQEKWKADGSPAIITLRFQAVR